MIDAKEDPDHAANVMARERAERHAIMRNGRADATNRRERKFGTLSALPSAPPSASDSGTLALESAVPSRAASQGSESPMPGRTGIIVSAALIVVLLVAWFLERRRR